MEINQPNNTEDKEFDAIKAKIPFDEGDKKKEEPKEEVVVPPVVTPPTPPKEPVVPPVVAKTEEDDDPKKPSRPERYIPVKQYTDEKSKFKETIADQAQKIAELETIAAAKPDTKKNDDLIKSYCEKYDVDEETAKTEIDRMRFVAEFGKEKPEPKKPEDPQVPKFTPEQEARIKEADEIKAQQLFNEEFNTVGVPQLKSLFPNATQAQLDAAREEMEALATTSSYLDKSLDYIAFKEKDTFAKIFAEDRKGPESKKAPQKGAQTLTSSDFEKGATPFSELDNLAPAEVDKIVKGFSIKTWDAYTHYKNQQQDINIS